MWFVHESNIMLGIAKNSVVLLKVKVLFLSLICEKRARSVCSNGNIDCLDLVTFYCVHQNVVDELSLKVPHPMVVLMVLFGLTGDVHLLCAYFWSIPLT